MRSRTFSFFDSPLDSGEDFDVELLAGIFLSAMG